MSGINVLLVDDEPLLLDSLEIILTFNKMNIVGKAGDGNEALEILAEVGSGAGSERSDCNLALVDLNMKGMGGIQLIKHIRAKYPHIKILVLTTFYDNKNITEAILGGADGYLLKDSGADAIIGAVEQIMNGRNVIDNKVMQRLAVIMGQAAGAAGEMADDGKQNIRNQNSEKQGVRNQNCGKQSVDVDNAVMHIPAGITERESEVCTLLAKGYTNRQIADALYISEGTVKNYISSIYDKTGIHDRAKLIVAIRE